MGILDSIKGLEIIQVSEVDNLSENHYVQYLDFIDVVKDITVGGKPKDPLFVETLLDDGFIDKETSSAMKRGSDEEFNMPVMSLSLALHKVLVEFKTENIELKDAGEPHAAVYYHLVKNIVSTIKELALISKNEMNVTDYKIEEGDDFRRKLVSKILLCSNMIQSRSRRGPGSFVLAKREYIEAASAYKPNTYLYPLEFHPIANLKMFVCDDLGDEIIVGRCGTKEEPGIRLISNADALEKDLTFNETDISGINIKYALGAFSPNDKQNYLSFKVQK